MAARITILSNTLQKAGKDFFVIGLVQPVVFERVNYNYSSPPSALKQMINLAESVIIT